MTRLPAAVLWDMDGTLIDTESYWEVHERALVESFGGTWTHENAMALVGNPLDVSAAYIRSVSPVTLSDEAIIGRMQAGVMDLMAQKMPWRPGALELLTALREREVRCALVTMSWRPMVDVLLGALPADTFEVVVTGDTVSHGKPHPEAYLTAAERLGEDPADCVALEDSPGGASAGVAAGARTIVIPHVVPVPHQDGLARLETLAGVGPEDLWNLSAT